MKALKKTVTYRATAIIGSLLLFGGSFSLIPNTAGAFVGGFVISEAYRSGLYFAHEKFYEWKDKPKPKQPKEPELELHAYHKKYGVDDFT